MEQRPYWIYMLYDLWRFRVLLLLPLMRAVAALFVGRVPPWRPYEWIVGAVLVGYAWFKWYRSRYRLTASAEDRFHSIGVRQGVLWRRTLRILAEDAASVEIERTPLLWLLGGRRIRVNTAGLRRRADVQLYLSSASTKAIFPVEKGAQRYRASRIPVLVISLTGSNAAMGLLSAIPVLYRVSRTLGSTVTEEVVGFVDRFWQLGLPLTLRLAANLLLVGWAVSAVRSFFRYAGFCAQREDGFLHLISGVFTRREVLINDDKITALELRQTLTMRLFSLYTAVITAAGYGRDIGTRPVLIPAAHPRELAAGLDRLLPDYPVCRSLLRPSAQSRWRYVAAPLALAIFGGMLCLLGTWWRVVGAVWIGVSLWWFVIRNIGFRRAGFGYNREAVTLCYPRGLALYQVYLPQSVVDCVSITRSPLQRRRGMCTVRVRCFGEKKRVHRVWGLPYDAVCCMTRQ